ncbi:hypothetical protein PHLGIDRAFT_311098 [Phlebiopsis gigantea 11061_1 CR5-6]|uniref:Uncharacterized protein n=1 Tax=Phlebiopsis gigantea (strain 11061_1 CR5-6) TaxID=745531 RepID=A0A0C3NC50_PHLG1|nr:hypothetical protein PHLGIDRAFT_311098 [Phlebiopsis gigantea 11061_1 CR5-6]
MPVAVGAFGAGLSAAELRRPLALAPVLDACSYLEYAADAASLRAGGRARGSGGSAVHILRHGGGGQRPARDTARAVHVCAVECRPGRSMAGWGSLWRAEYGVITPDAMGAGLDDAARSTTLQRHLTEV